MSTSSVFPLSRIKRIIKEDPDIQMVAADASLAVSIATEKFIEILIQKAGEYSSKDKRKGIMYKDVARAVIDEQKFRFLDDMIPMTIPLSEAMQNQRREDDEAKKAAAKIRAEEREKRKLNDGNGNAGYEDDEIGDDEQEHDENSMQSGGHGKKKKGTPSSASAKKKSSTTSSIKKGGKEDKSPSKKPKKQQKTLDSIFGKPNDKKSSPEKNSKATTSENLENQNDSTFSHKITDSYRKQQKENEGFLENNLEEPVSSAQDGIDDVSMNKDNHEKKVAQLDE